MENNEFKLLQPKEVKVDGKTYIISKIPAFQAREIMVKYIPTHLMNINGDYEKIKELVLKLMSYVAVKVDYKKEDGTTDTRTIRLETETLINNHCPTWETLCNIESLMIDYNTSFFKDGKGLTFFQKLEFLAERKVTEILTVLSDRLLQRNKQPSGN